jgi:hypothetical protein
VRSAELESVQAALQERQLLLTKSDDKLSNSQLHISELLKEVASIQFEKSQVSEILGVRSAELESVQAALQEERARSEWLGNEWGASKLKVDNLNYWSHYWWLKSEELKDELMMMRSSISWLITKPIRLISVGMKSAEEFIYSFFIKTRIFFKILIIKTLNIFIRIANKNPSLKKISLSFLHQHPTIYKKVLSLKIQGEANGYKKGPPEFIDAVGSISCKKLSDEINEMSLAAPCRVVKIYKNLLISKADIGKLE